MEDDEQDGAAKVTNGKNGSDRDVDEEQLRRHAVECKNCEQHSPNKERPPLLASQRTNRLSLFSCQP
ncbi:hypothetical protein PIB30_055684 [Stylosanthes scabra]|uniref:Uncharacterized protein n=1 Tax=Stylosanthes scabra TaxID=79078 RepID=A0ABU6RJH6_9FABA|nr:hypothetical protein [Stylosanthes scabra]